MDARTRELVRRRAGLRCEYCHLSEAAVPYLVYSRAAVILGIERSTLDRKIRWYDLVERAHND